MIVEESQGGRRLVDADELLCALEHILGLLMGWGRLRETVSVSRTRDGGAVEGSIC